jgi:hypothetical protein
MDLPVRAERLGPREHPGSYPSGGQSVISLRLGDCCGRKNVALLPVPFGRLTVRLSPCMHALCGIGYVRLLCGEALK